MIINKVVTISWKQEEKETITSFREFLQDKMLEIGENSEYLYNTLDEIDYLLNSLLVTDFDEEV